MPGQLPADRSHKITIPLFEPPMVGRFAETDEFWRLLHRAMGDQQGQVLLIEGEAGIGKSKFLRFCREATASLPVRVMAGAFHAHVGGAYAGIREALEELFGGERLEPDPVAVSAWIAATLPELGYPDSVAEAADVARFLTQYLRPMPGPSGEPVGLTGPGAGEERRHYVIARLGRFLRRASLHVPLLLLLEDVHWADAESVTLLQHLAAVLATDPARLLIIATMRAGDREPNPALEAALQKMARFEGTCTRRLFTRLGEDDTSRLIEESLQAELVDKAAVYRLAEGNPLHVLSILRYLHSEELLEATSSGWRVKQGVQLNEILPPTVREVIGLRVQRLVTQDEEGPRRRETLFWAAVAGRRFEVEVLADAMREGAPELGARMDSHLDSLLAAGLLHECVGLPGDVLEFDHHLLREVVLAQQEGPRAERARHRCLAAAKLRRAERGDRSLLPEVAHHYLQAREWTEAARYHKLAGDVALDSLAFHEAAGLYETAARLLGEQPSVALSTDERAALFGAQAEALETLGQMDEALAAQRAAQAHAGENRVLWARSERSIAWLLSRGGRLDEAAAACERAREVLEEIGAEADLADVLRTLGVVEVLRGRYEAALAHVQRALAIYQEAEQLEGVGRCYGYMAQIYLDRGELEAMLDATQRAWAISEAVGHPVSVGQALNDVACALTALGRDAEALPLLFRAVEIFERHHIEKYLPSVYHSLAEALLKCGRGEEARPYLERGLESARRVGQVRTVANFHCLLARQAAAAGRPEEARRQFEEARRSCAGTGLEPQQAQICLAFGEFLRETGEAEEAARLFEEAQAIRRRLGSEGEV